MSGFFSSVFNLFLSPVGILVLSVLDASVVFFFPTAIDMAVILVSARSDDNLFTVPLLAVAGSVAGAALTFKIGGKIGEVGLERWISNRQLKRVRERLGHKGLMAVGTAALLPPPFPLTPFAMTSGALGMDIRKFLLVLAGARAIRFGIEAALASIYGQRVIAVMESDAFELFIAGLVVIAIVGTTYTLVQLIRRTR